MKRLKSGQIWLLLLAAAVLLFSLWFFVKSAPPNSFFRNASPQTVTSLSLLVEGGDYGKTATILQAQTTDKAAIGEFLELLGRERFWYDWNDGVRAPGEMILIYFDRAVGQKPFTLQLRKIPGGSDTVIITFENRRYFLERFSEEKELALYAALYDLVLGLQEK